MKLYADTSVRRTLQVAGDLTLVLWVWFWITMASQVHDATLSLATPHAWFLRGLADLSGGVVDVLPAVAALLAIGLATGTVAVLRIDKVVAP